MEYALETYSWPQLDPEKSLSVEIFSRALISPTCLNHGEEDKSFAPLKSQHRTTGPFKKCPRAKINLIWIYRHAFDCKQYTKKECDLLIDCDRQGLSARLVAKSTFGTLSLFPKYTSVLTLGIT